jgi:hypothetical protein
MRLINKSTIPTSLIRAIVKFVRPAGIKNFTVYIGECRARWKGRGGKSGIRVYVNPKAKYPAKFQTYQYGQLKARYTKADPVTGVMRQLKGRRYYHASLTEALIYLIAHELMHTKQQQRGLKRRGRKVWGARGRSSEIETESYAIRKLRDFRQNS